MRTTAGTSILVALLVLAGSAVAQPGATQRGLPELPGNIVRVSANEFSFRAPDSIPAGVTTFVLRQEGRALQGAHLSPAQRDSFVRHGADPTAALHMLWVVRLDSGKTAAEFFDAASNNRPAPWARSLGGPGFVYPPRTTNATLALQPGNYVLVCYVGSAREDRRRNHLLHGMFRPLTVLPSRKSTRLPRPDLVVTLRGGDSVEFSRAVSRPGTWRILVRNESGAGTEFRVARVFPGHTAAEAVAWRREDGKPFVGEGWGGTSGIRRGASLLTTVDLPPGTYLINGKPVVIRGG